MIAFSVNQLSGKTIAPKNFRRWLAAIAAATGSTKQYQLSIAIVSPTVMRQLNHMYRGKDTVTDVLSFAEMDVTTPVPATGEPTNLGEVVLCYNQIKAQASGHGKTLLEEIEFLFIHGVLHLLGYDHQTAKDAKKMENLERKILMVRKS